MELSCDKHTNSTQETKDSLCTVSSYEIATPSCVELHKLDTRIIDLAETQ